MAHRGKINGSFPSSDEIGSVPATEGLFFLPFVPHQKRKEFLPNAASGRKRSRLGLGPDPGRDRVPTYEDARTVRASYSRRLDEENAVAC